jgi:hypothetical protein
MLDYSTLPIEVINKIINYTDVIVFRNGKYIDRLKKDDSRYDIIKKRKLPIWIGTNRFVFYFKFFNGFKTRGFAIEHDYNIRTNQHLLYKRELIKLDNGSIQDESQTNYIIDSNGVCRINVYY